VGTRKPSGVGVSCARRVSRELSERGIVLVSGLARGIDSAAHRGAIDTGGCTIAVLGHGCDYIYPHAHFNLACEMLQNGGALVSEYPPGTRPAPFRFPERNRIISGMSEGLMLVEAPEKSGALITVDFALEQGRDVFVMPETLNSRRNEGGRQLYEHGAPAMDNAVEILRYLRGDYA
ncbi:MAG: DNA-processing protein DprA, partial [Salinispira sp.]